MSEDVQNAETNRIEFSRAFVEEVAEILRGFIENSILPKEKQKNIVCLNTLDRKGLRMLDAFMAQGIEIEGMDEPLKWLIQQVQWLKTPPSPYEVYVLATIEDALMVVVGLHHAFGLSVNSILPTQGNHEKLLTFILDPSKHPYEELLEWLQEQNTIICALRILPSGETQEQTRLRSKGSTEIEEDSVENVYPAWRDASEIDVLNLSSTYNLNTETILEQIAALSVRGIHVTNGVIEDEIVGVSRQKRGQ